MQTELKQFLAKIDLNQPEPENIAQLQNILIHQSRETLNVLDQLLAYLIENDDKVYLIHLVGLVRHDVANLYYKSGIETTIKCLLHVITQMKKPESTAFIMINAVNNMAEAALV